MAFALPPHCTLIAEIGAGTTFEVAIVEWEGAEHVARRLRRSLAGTPDGDRAFSRHLAVLERVIHPAVPPLRRAGRDDHGRFSIEERAPGLPLRQLVDDHRRTRGPLPGPLVRALATSAFTALADLAELADERGPLGFVHGDLGPDHVFVAPAAEGTSVRFVDFGLARMAGVESEPGARGSLPYVAPEVARGEARPSAATDAFALAASFAYAVLGRDPCRKHGPARLVEVAERGLDLAALAEAPCDERTREVLVAALAFDPARRPSGARTIADWLGGT